MKRFSEQLHAKALGVKLSASERRELRERICSYMEYHPLPQRDELVNNAAPSAAGKLFSDSFTTVRLSFGQVARWSGVVVCLCVVSISYMAENAIPGDVLYAVKVGVNEEVRAGLAFSPYEKITWETERLNRRIAEARVLADAGLLTGEVEEEVAAAVRAHGENARREIEELKQTDSDEAALASMQLSTTLDVQSAVLRMGSRLAKNSEGGENSTALATAIEEERKNTQAPEGSVLPGYERLLAHVEADTTRARELLSSVEGVATKNETRDITRRLEDVDRMLEHALKVAPKDTEKAQTILVDVLQRTQKLIVFMTNIDVRSAMNVEDIVPVVLTDDERRAVLVDTMAELEANYKRLRAALEGDTDALDTAVHKKLKLAFEEIETDFKAAEEAFKNGALDEAEQKTLSAQILALDTLTLLDAATTPMPVEEVPDSVSTTTPEMTGGANGSTTTDGSTTGTSSTDSE